MKHLTFTEALDLASKIKAGTDLELVITDKDMCSVGNTLLMLGRLNQEPQRVYTVKTENNITTIHRKS